MFDSRKLIVEVVGDSRQLERTFKRAGKAADKFGTKMRKSLSTSGRKVAKGAGIGGALGGLGLLGAGVGAGVSSFKAAANFETTMARIQGLAGQSAKQVQQWSNQLIGLGPALGKTPQELAEALYFIASAGVPASKAISVLTASAKAASAGLGETEVVADAVTSVMNAYGPSVMSAVHATDVLVATVREGKGEADEFAGVIGNVAAFASRLNVPFEQVGAALAAMTQLGTDPRTAATQLSAFFSGVLKVTPKAKKAAESVGFSFGRLAQMLTRGNLIGALNYIKRAFAGNTQAMAAAFPNIRALRALLALTANDGGKVAGVFNRMKKSNGSLSAAWAATTKTSKHHMEQLGAAVNALKIAFGQGLAPVVARVANALAKKIANPAFVARVRRLGFLIGTTLVDMFARFKKWFVANWPAIQKAIQRTARVIIGVMKAAQWLDKHKGPSGKDLAHKATGLFGSIGHTIQGGVRAGMSGGGGGGKQQAGDVYLDGQKVGKHVTNTQKRGAKSTPASRRGRHGGLANYPH